MINYSQIFLYLLAFIYLVACFFIVYHLLRFGIGIETKFLALIFIIGIVLLFFLFWLALNNFNDVVKTTCVLLNYT